ncbi:glycosyltransferase family 4 protein [candidate division FCPU426 bacterium]|nr:glycosyltransferase family 4 protein [candidate division FCPU426 bacterium]
MNTEPMRNLQMISSPGVGGREIDVPVLARKLIALGHPTWVMCRLHTLVEKLSRAWNIPVEPTRMNWYFNPASILAVARFLKKNRIQVIHAHWSRDLSNLIIAARLAGGVPIVLTKHVYATEKKHDFFHDWVYGQVDRVIAISQVVADNVVKTVRLPGAKVVTIYNGIELNRQWNPDLTRHADLRSEFGVPAGKPVVGYVGRLNQGKGPHFIIEAFTHLAARFPDWHLVLVGKAVGENEEAYVEKIKAGITASGLGQRIHLAGYRTDMPAVMHTFDLLVNASAFESLGMVLVEAMAMERPVIGPDTGGVPEIIEPGESGEVFTYGNSSDLAEKLGRLMTDAERRRLMGKRGREIALRKFNLDVMARKVLEVFREAAVPRKVKI